MFGRSFQALSALCVGALLLLAAAAMAAPLDRVEIVSQSGVHVFEVEVAATGEARTKGLMFRKELPAGRGMLFDFGSEGHVGMWMKNTYIPLDMIFIRADGRIVRIAENTVPHSEETIASGAPVLAVLEVIGGTARRLGIRPGDRVAHRIFRRR
jgi:uncharacterized membrane protein (UPF0127 family)